MKSLTKQGYPNTHGFLAYLQCGILFRLWLMSSKKLKLSSKKAEWKCIRSITNGKLLHASIWSLGYCLFSATVLVPYKSSYVCLFHSNKLISEAHFLLMQCDFKPSIRWNGYFSKVEQALNEVTKH